MQSWQQLGDFYFETSFYEPLGSLYLVLGDVEQGLVIKQQGLSQARALGLDAVIMDLLIIESQWYFALEDYDRAKPLILELINDYQLPATHPSFSRVYYELGLIQFEQNEYADAAQSAHTSLSGQSYIARVFDSYNYALLAKSLITKQQPTSQCLYRAGPCSC